MTPPRMYVEGQNETRVCEERRRGNTIVERNDDDQHRDRVILYVNKGRKREPKRALLSSL